MRLSFTITAALLFCSAEFQSQETFVEYQVLPKGGQLQFDQVIETQLTLPPVLLTRTFEAEIKAAFSIDSAGGATGLVIEGAQNNALRGEIARLMKFYRFSRTSLPLTSPQPYFVVFNLSTARYRRYLKQRSKTRISVPPADSSFAIVTRADRAPEYYRNKEAGLTEYILSEISYPPLAIEKSVEGTVVIEFVVEPNGFVTCIEARKQVGAGCTDEAIRLIRETRWQPATIGGKAVRYKMTYPITFSLRNAGKGEFHPATTVGN